MFVRACLTAIPLVLACPAFAQDAPADIAEDESNIVVTAARTQLPASALPLTIDIVASEALEQQVQISGSTVIGGTGGVVNQVTAGAPTEDGLAIRTLVQGSAADGFDGATLGGKLGALAGYRAGAFEAAVGAAFERRGVFQDGHGNNIGVDGTPGEVQDSASWSVFGRFG